MNADRKSRLKNPPLIEAVFEAFVVPNDSRELAESAVSRIREECRARFDGEIRDLVEQQLQVGLHPGGIVAQSATQERRTQMWRNDKGQLVQFGSRMASVNYLGTAYLTYEEHADETVAFLSAYLSYSQPKEISHFGQRFINRVCVPDNESPDRYLRIYPTLPEELRIEHRPFAVQIQTSVLRAGGGVTLSLVYQGLRETKHVYVLDIYARSDSRPGDLKSWHDDAHDAVRRAFRLALTEEGFASFQETK